MAKTKRDYFNELKGYVVDNDALTAFIDHELDLMDKKNAAPRARTAKQISNDALKGYILENLDGAMSVSEMIKGFLKDYTEPVSSQRASAVLTQMKNDGTVIRTVEGRTAKFTVA